MNKKYLYHTKNALLQPAFFIRILGVSLFSIGIFIVVYVFSPLIIWQFTLGPQIASSQMTIPIPKRNLLTPMSIQSLISSSLHSIGGADYTDAANWFPGFVISKNAPQESSYFLTIPKLNITNAFVSTTDTNLANHLVSLAGTALPPEKGNTVIFGHSTLPQLYDRNNYKTIFTNLYKMQIDDTFEITINNIIYSYQVFSISVVDPTDTSVLAQTYDDSYVTLITCTPPGTIWKRLIIKARIEKLN